MPERHPTLGRRMRLAGAAGLAAWPAAAAGPVFRGLSQAVLDDAYTQTVWAPDTPDIIASYARDIAAARVVLPLSNLRHIGRIACPVLVVAGGCESPEFKRQASIFANVLAGAGRLHARVVMPELNHFEVPSQLIRVDTPLSQAVLGMTRAGRTSPDGDWATRRHHGEKRW